MKTVPQPPTTTQEKSEIYMNIDNILTMIELRVQDNLQKKIEKLNTCHTSLKI